METSSLNQEIFMVSIPKVETKRFKGFAKLMGWTITSTAKADKARLYDPETGKYLNEETMSVIEDSRRGIGVKSYASFDDFAKAMRTL